MTASSAPDPNSTLHPCASAYRGRFAPSPTGRLHLGSLLSGYGALWRTRSQNGTFIIRLEDLDSTRCTLLNLLHIYQDLVLFGLTSDEEIMVQSEHTEVYEQCLAPLLAQNYAYYCTCTRAQLQQRPCHCMQPAVQARMREQLAAEASTQDATATALAVRLDLSALLEQPSLQQFTDSHLGIIAQPRQPTSNQSHTTLPSLLTLKRSDSFYAYNFAVVIDDHRQGISEVVRGADLLDSTFLQLALYQLLGYSAPSFCHLPLLTNAKGQKLSKQNNAPAAVVAYTPYQALDYCWQYLQHRTITTANSVITCVNSDPIITQLQEQIARDERQLIKVIEPYQDEFETIKQNYIAQYLSCLPPATKNKISHSSEVFPSDSRHMQTYLLNALLYTHLASIPTDTTLQQGYQHATHRRDLALATATRENQALIIATSLDTLGSWFMEYVLTDSAVASLPHLVAHYYALLSELNRQFVARFDLHAMPQKALVV